MSGPELPPPKGTTEREIPWRLVAWIALAVYAVLFVLVNDETQDVSFVFFSIRTKLIWLILLSMGIGAVLAVFGPRLWRSRRRR